MCVGVYTIFTSYFVLHCVAYVGINTEQVRVARLRTLRYPQTSSKAYISYKVDQQTPPKPTQGGEGGESVVSHLLLAFIFSVNVRMRVHSTSLHDLTDPQVPVKQRRRHVHPFQNVRDSFLHRSESLQDLVRVGLPLDQGGTAVSLVLQVESANPTASQPVVRHSVIPSARRQLSVISRRVQHGRKRRVTGLYAWFGVRRRRIKAHATMILIFI